MSKQRILILRTVEESYTHPTAEDVLAEARKEMPHLAVGTVYRNLQQLTEEGLVRKIEMPQGGARYDRNYDNHAHFVCVYCGSIEDTPLPFSEDLLHLPKDSSLVGVEMQIRYRCPTCRAH